MSMDKWFYDRAREGKLYHACSAGAVTLSTVNATCTGLSLANPPSSGVLLVLKEINFAPSTAPANPSVVGIAMAPAVSNTEVVHGTAMVVHSGYARGSDVMTAVGKADAASTLPNTPVWWRPMSAVTAASSITPTEYFAELNGSVILPPGMHLSLSYLTTAAVGIASVTWAEVKE